MSLLFSIVIPTYHRNDLLRLCLERLAPGVQTIEASAYEVIVTDDGREDTAKEMMSVHFPWAKWVQGPKRGPAANRNNGAGSSNGHWVVFIDDDCLPDPTLLAAYQTQLLANTSKVYEGRIYADRPKKKLNEESPINEHGGYLWSCNFCIHRGLFQELGGFDETFPYAAMEDVDLDYRLRQSGHRPMFTPEAAVLHPWRIAGGWKAERKRLDSILHYLKKHPEEQKRLNSMFFIRSIYHNLKDYLSGIIKFGFDGSSYMLVKASLNLLALSKIHF